MEFVVTPWEVRGKVDYQKLIKRFGTQPITPQLKKRIEKHGKLHVMLRRDIYYSHRDLHKVLDDYEKGKGFFLYTGRGPSGKMHLGHLLPFIFTKWLQKTFKANLYIEITDDEKFLVKEQAKWEKIKEYSWDNILNIAALKFNKNRTFIFRDSEYIHNIYPLAIKIAKKINFSTVRAVFGFTNQTNIGMIFFPSLQIVPTMFEKKRCLIPAAIDQDPYWRVQRDLADKLGYYKAACIHSKMLPALTGFEEKMSSSKPQTAIFLDDDEKTIRKKIYKYAFSGGQPTVELHRKLGGNPDADVSFQWLKYFFEPNDKKLKKIEEDYRSGKLLTGELKEILIEKLTKFLNNFQKNKEKAENFVDDYLYYGKLASKMWETIFE